MVYACSKTDEAMRAAWKAKHHLRAATRRTGWQPLIGKRGMRVSGWDDHGELWNRYSRPVCYTAQPYALTADDRAALDALASVHGVSVEIHPKAESWYYPGSTWLVVIWAPGVERVS